MNKDGKKAINLTDKNNILQKNKLIRYYLEKCLQTNLVMIILHQKILSKNIVLILLGQPSQPLDHRYHRQNNHATNH